jgi:tripartite-type tricarboxylate transporter receptor subunit TctC
VNKHEETIRREQMAKPGISRRAATLGIAATVLAIGGRVYGQGDGIKGPITIVVPFAAGGATDVVTRLIGKKLAERVSVSVVVENAGGAGGVIGATRVARAAPDGTVLLMGTVATHAINPLMAKQTPYDPVNDFTPISLIATVPNALLVGPQVKATNVSELISLLKSESGRYNYGSSGNGTPPHLSGELFKAMAGVEMTHVPYRGGGPAMTDLIGGQIPILFDVLTGAANFVREGTVRALAVTTKSRSSSFPNVPTVAESGLPGYETYTWNAVFGPARMPAQLVERVSSELRQVVADPEMQKRLKELSAEPVGSSPDTLAAQVKAELAKWAPIIKAAGLE